MKFFQKSKLNSGRCFREFRLVYLSFLVVLLLTGCNFFETKTITIPTEPESITLMTWNLHNLFDGIDRDTKYDEYREAAGWSTEKYLGRLNSFAAAINIVDPKPDIIIIQEIESIDVVNDLAGLLSGFYWTHFASNPEAALGIGIMSNYPLKDAKAHSIAINDGTIPRPVLETRIQAEDEDFIIFSCHWKSKVGNAVITERLRKAAARVILRRIRELQEVEPELGIIVAGDLNENYDEFNRTGSNVICALLPDDWYSAQLTGLNREDNLENPDSQKDFIVISKNKPPATVYFHDDTIILYSPWVDELENGSYFYRNNWETIDHFLISDHFFNNIGWDYNKAVIVDYQPFVNSDGIPVPFNPRTGLGLSDHLPLLITLKIQTSTAVIP